MAVVVEHVTKRFRHNGDTLEALHDVNLTIEDGEFVCLLGPSGCGKSTLLHVIAGLERSDEGRVLVNGVPVIGPGRDCVVVFQDAALFPWLTVQANVEFGLQMTGVPKAQRQATALEYLQLVHLTKFVDAYPFQLSGGMKQRVAIARALAMEPKVLLMDEPFGALDAQTRSLLQDELLEIWRTTHKTIFFVTHNVREATGLADRVYEISARPGRIKRSYRIDVPRPRTATDPRLLAVQRRILDSLAEEIAKVMHHELNLEMGPPQTDGVVPADRTLGMHI